MNELLPLADILLMPSELESFGLAALEAMACKVPSIATRVGGVPELIDDGETGLLYEVGDIDGMAQGALSLLGDRERLNAMREAGRQDSTKALLLLAGGTPLCGLLQAGAGHGAVMRACCRAVQGINLRICEARV